MQLLTGDCLEIMPTMEANSIDTIITDPPYGLGFMGKDWDYGIPGKRFWMEALRVAKPGAILLAFGGTRTHHRLMVAIEDAGWEIRDCIMWVYGSGFPKSHDISKAIDKAAGAEVSSDGYIPNGKNNTHGKGWGGGRKTQISAPATPAAQLWDGWGTALKPAYEPIIVAMKPIDGTFAANALAHGVAGMWIDGSRVPSTRDSYQDHANGSGTCAANINDDHSADKDRLHNAGHLRRTLDKLSQHVGCELFPNRHFPNDETYVRYVASSLGFQGDCLPYHRLCDELFRLVSEGGLLPQTLQDDVLKCIHPCEHWDDLGLEYKHSLSCPNTARLSSWDAFRACVSSIYSLIYKLQPIHNYTTPDTKTHGRRWPANLIHDGSDEVTGLFPNDAARFFYCAKASRAERNAGLEGMEKKPAGSLNIRADAHSIKNGMNTAEASNNHPTVKPLALMRYLARLTKTPTGGIILDLFMGSGTTGIAAVLEGRDFVGIEKDADYVEIAQKRIEHHSQQARQLEMELCNN